MKILMLICVAITSLAPLSHGKQRIIPDEAEFVVRLLSPISTQTNRKGDKIAAQVLSPIQFEGSIMEGSVKKSKSGKRIKGKSELNFSFDTLNYEERQVPVQASVTSMRNSKGEQDVDEEGLIIKRKNNLGKTAAATGVGALIGAIAGGAKGAAIGAGVGAAASLIFIQVAAKGANISFAPGSEFVLTVKQR